MEYHQKIKKDEYHGKVSKLIMSIWLTDYFCNNSTCFQFSSNTDFPNVFRILSTSVAG